MFEFCIVVRLYTGPCDDTQHKYTHGSQHKVNQEKTKAEVDYNVSTWWGVLGSTYTQRYNPLYHIGSYKCQ